MSLPVSMGLVQYVYLHPKDLSDNRMNLQGIIDEGKRDTKKYEVVITLRAFPVSYDFSLHGRWSEHFKKGDYLVYRTIQDDNPDDVDIQFEEPEQVVEVWAIRKHLFEEIAKEVE